MTKFLKRLITIIAGSFLLILIAVSFYPIVLVQIIFYLSGYKGQNILECVPKYLNDKLDQLGEWADA